MKMAAYLLLIGGFLGGAYATALDTQVTNWGLFVPAAIVAVAGVVLLKWHTRGTARSEEVLSANRVELTESLDNVVATLDRLLADQELEGERLRDTIDNELANDLRRFAEARESMVHLFGIQNYANIMSEFAAGERYVNRVWSSSADGYDEEAATYLEKAATQFRHARSELGQLAGSAA